VSQGFPDKRQAEAGRQTLERFAVEPMVGRESRSLRPRTNAGCAPRGITLRRTKDLLIDRLERVRSWNMTDPQGLPSLLL
jgi:hypothetical protein